MSDSLSAGGSGNHRTAFTVAAILCGGIALLLAVTQFFAGPFETQPPLEKVVADKVVAIRDATVAALKGEEYEAATEPRGVSIDRMVRIGTAVAGALAMILAAVALVRRERAAAAAGGAILGASAIALQFAGIALGVIVLCLLIGPLLSALDFDFSFFD
ncbi:MAG: hypothetical protein AAGG11_08675 [Pseudomonadota bacterium]